MAVYPETTLHRLEQLDRVQAELREMFATKNASYGDSFAEYGPVGVIIRFGDKIKRAATISHTGINFVEDEKLRDTLMDLANYACMAVMLLDEKKG